MIWYPLYRRSGGPQYPTGWVWKMSVILGFNPQPAHSELLYCLCYPRPLFPLYCYDIHWFNSYVVPITFYLCSMIPHVAFAWLCDHSIGHITDTMTEWSFQTILIIAYVSIPLCGNIMSVTDNCMHSWFYCLPQMQYHHIVSNMFQLPQAISMASLLKGLLLMPKL